MTGRAELVLAPNPGPMTFDGTNSWVLSEPGSSEAVVIDPGPNDPGHLHRLVTVAAARRTTITRILLSHRHPDHSAGARSLADQVGAPVGAFSPEFADEVLLGGEVLQVGDLRIEVVPTPGHTSDSLSFRLAADHTLLTGDTLLGRGAPAILHPDGQVADMIASLQRLQSLAVPGAVVLPGHGPVVRDPAVLLTNALQARWSRIEELRGLVRQGRHTATEIVGLLYPDLDDRIRRAAEANVQAHLVYLEQSR